MSKLSHIETKSDGSFFPRERRHTLYFLREARSVAPIFLDVLVDMTETLALRERWRRCSMRLSVTTILIHAIAQAMAEMPATNIAVSGSIFAKQRRYDAVHAKFTMDKTIGTARVVCSTVLHRADSLHLQEIQAGIDFFKRADVSIAPSFARMRLLHRLAPFLGYWLYWAVVRSLNRRQAVHGSFAITSLGRYAINSFFPISGGTFTFGIGKIAQTPVVRAGQIEVAPILRLCLTFDHRALDGAIVAELLDAIKYRLEHLEQRDPV